MRPERHRFSGRVEGGGPRGRAFHFRITLRDVAPPIGRLIQLPASYRLLGSAPGHPGRHGVGHRERSRYRQPDTPMFRRVSQVVVRSSVLPCSQQHRVSFLTACCYERNTALLRTKHCAVASAILRCYEGDTALSSSQQHAVANTSRGNHKSLAAAGHIQGLARRLAGRPQSPLSIEVKIPGRCPGRRRGPPLPPARQMSDTAQDQASAKALPSPHRPRSFALCGHGPRGLTRARSRAALQTGATHHPRIQPDDAPAPIPSAAHAHGWQRRRPGRLGGDGRRGCRRVAGRRAVGRH